MQRMTDHGMPLTLYGYAALVTAYKNKVPVNDESFNRVSEREREKSSKCVSE